MKIEITIPVLNEEATIVEQIQKLSEFISHNLQDLGTIKIIIADNGSSDGTRNRVQLLVNNSTKIEYIRLEHRGVGLALKASWANSKADIVGYMDLDLATDLTHIRPALEALITKQAEIVTGTRLAKGAKVIGRTKLRDITSICFNALVKLCFSTSFTDGMCGFKFLHRDIFDKLSLSGANSDGWFFATELLVVSEHLNFKIYDLPIMWTDDPNSKVKIFRLAIEYLKAIFLLKRRLKNITRYN